jgi:hypothetical protein
MSQVKGRTLVPHVASQTADLYQRERDELRLRPLCWVPTAQTNAKTADLILNPYARRYGITLHTPTELTTSRVAEGSGIYNRLSPPI